MILKLFRLTAILEGFSYLALFGFSMPLKYWAKIPEPNIYIGYIHGFLFIAFVALALIFCWQHKWSLKRLIILILAALLPFGTFYAEKKYLKPLALA